MHLVSCELLSCLQQTLKLPGFSLHQMTDDRCWSTGGLLQLQVVLLLVHLILQSGAKKQDHLLWTAIMYIAIFSTSSITKSKSGIFYYITPA